MTDESVPAPTASTDLGEIFARDPLKLTRTDIDYVIAYMREARKRYLIAEKAPKAVKEPKAKKAKGSAESIDIGSLDL